MTIQLRMMVRYLGALVLSLILRVPFVLGMLIGFLGLCIVAFLEGFHTVYDGKAGR